MGKRNKAHTFYTFRRVLFSLNGWGPINVAHVEISSLQRNTMLYHISFFNSFPSEKKTYFSCQKMFFFLFPSLRLQFLKIFLVVFFVIRNALILQLLVFLQAIDVAILVVHFCRGTIFRNFFQKAIEKHLKGPNILRPCESKKTNFTFFGLEFADISIFSVLKMNFLPKYYYNLIIGY